MFPKTDLSGLIDASQKLGADWACVQGGGGNTSLKTDDGMWIKASGLALGDVSAQRGFVFVDDNFIRRELSACHTEAAYTDVLVNAVLEGQGRPSIEAGFHAILGRCVLHTHPVLANLLCCAQEGEEMAKQLFPGALWIPYATPGLPLTDHVRTRVVGDETLIFLQNHGLIVIGDDPIKAMVAHAQCLQTLADAFSLSNDTIKNSIYNNANAGYALSVAADEADADHAFFPDQVVYLHNDELQKTKAGQETLFAYASLRGFIPKLGLTPRYLDRASVETLSAMESEKYRQKVSAS